MFSFSTISPYENPTGIVEPYQSSYSIATARLTAILKGNPSESNFCRCAITGFTETEAFSGSTANCTRMRTPRSSRILLFYIFLYRISRFLTCAFAILDQDSAHRWWWTSETQCILAVWRGSSADYVSRLGQLVKISRLDSFWLPLRRWSWTLVSNSDIVLRYSKGDAFPGRWRKDSRRFRPTQMATHLSPFIQSLHVDDQSTTSWSRLWWFDIMWRGLCITFISFISFLPDLI